MASGHRDTVGVIEPSALAYTYLLSGFCDDVEGDIVDPIGMGKEVYEASFAVIVKCVEAMRKKIETFDGWKTIEFEREG